MARGRPDFGANAVRVTVAGLSDMGELAARLGSIVTFDRRGDIVWLDSFEGEVDKWYPVTQGTGAAVVVSPEAARNGSFSAKLTTGDEIDDYAEIRHYLPYPVVSKIGLEVSFTTWNDISEFIFQMRLNDGSYEHWSELRYLKGTAKLQYWDSAGALQDLATSVQVWSTVLAFHTIKFVIDLETYKYVRAIFNNVEYDMSALSYQLTADTTTKPNWTSYIRVITGADSNESAYIDDAILTQNEP